MSRKNAKTSPARLPAWGVGVQTTLALGAIGAAGDVFAFSPLIGFGAGAVGAMCSVLRTAGDEHTTGPDRVLIQLGRWSGVGGWLTWVWTTPADGIARFMDVFGVDAAGDPLSLAGMGTLAAGTQIGAHLSPRTKKTEEPGGGLVLRSATKAAQQWQADILAVDSTRMRGLIVQNVQPWPNGYGEDVYAVLPDTGVTADDLRRILGSIASRRDLPRGCTIELIEPDGGRRSVILRVSTVNRLDEVIDYPAGYELGRSIMDGISFGEHANAETASAPIREESWLIVGKKGAGKTTLLHGLTATIGMCADAVVWHIDLNGGSLSQPWVAPWIEGQCARCAVDWPASTVDEALRMLTAAVRIAKHRKVAYRKLKHQHNVSLLPVSGDLPAIEIILDEGAEAMAAAGRGKVAKLSGLLEEIMRIARDAAVNEVLSVLRGTGDLIPAGMTAQTGVAMCMKVEKEKEMAAVFEWNSGVDHRDLKRKGAGFVRADGGEIRQFQTWNILPAQIEEIALLISRHRPDVDAASAQAAGEDYATRWTRARRYFADDADPDEVDAMFAKGTAAGDDDDPFASWGDPADVAAGGVGVLTRPQVAAAEGARGRVVAPLLVDALGVFDAEDSDRVPRTVLAEWLTGGDEDQLREQMKDAGAGSPRPLRWRGQMDRGYYRADVEAAMGP